jgi:hypothetical protein
MSQSFAVNWNATNTASATVPMINGMNTATNAMQIYEINTGSDATADNAVKYRIERSTARGTQSTSITPSDIGTAAATAACTFDSAWNINPTIGGAILLQWGQHQRGTYRWVAYDYTKMLQTQAGTGKGLALVSVVVTSAFNGVFNLEYQE